MVTLDADGQNDPGEIETMLQPLVDDEADFVVASRRLGVDTTDDTYRKAGVVVFAFMMNQLNGTHLTDTSNGYRALRSAVLADVVGRLEQDQYQTAELLTTAVRGAGGSPSGPPSGTSASRGLQEGREPALRLPLRPGGARHAWRSATCHATRSGRSTPRPMSLTPGSPDRARPRWATARVGGTMVDGARRRGHDGQHDVRLA